MATTKLKNQAFENVNLGTWTSFNPSLTNFTLGSGTHTGRYCQIGKTVFFTTYCTFANDSSIDGAMALTLPVTKSAGQGNITSIGQICFFDASTAFFEGVLWSNGALKILNASGTYVIHADTGSNIPMDVVSGDYLTISGAYEAA